MSGRAAMAPAVALVLLGGALVAVLAVTTPGLPGGWQQLGGVPRARVAGDFTVAEATRAGAYRSTVRPLAYLSLAVGLATALVLGLTPLGARLVAAVAEPVGGGWWARLLLGGIAVTLVVRAAALPLDARAEGVSRAYGLSTRSWAGWAADVAKGWAVSTGLVLVVLAGVLVLARRWPGGWWVPAAAGGALFVAGVSFVYPLVVEPVFNRFTALPAGPLRSDLLALAQRDGVPVTDVLVADASRRTSTLNAYVSGYGATRRVVVYDTLLAEATDEEVELIVAHELGHAAERDVLRGTLVGALGAAAGVCLLFLLLRPTGLVRRAGAEAVGDPRALALVLALVTVLGTLAGPAEALVSRRVETRADLHALDLTRDPETFARMQRRLALANLSDLTPPPVVFALFATHPTAPMRIALARGWAERRGVPVPGPLVGGP